MDSKNNIREEIKRLADDSFSERECLAVLVREPLIDPTFPDTSDIDIFGIDVSRDLGIETNRKIIGNRRYDVMWFADSLMQHPDFTRFLGNLPHQLVATSVVREVGKYGTSLIQMMKDMIYTEGAIATRIKNHLNTASQALSVAGRMTNPSEAFFFLTPASSGSIAALSDGKVSLINVQTKPYLKLIKTQPQLTDWFSDVCYLDRFDVNLIQELGDAVSEDYEGWEIPSGFLAGREWKTSMHYYPHKDEVKYRVSVIKEMISKGDLMDAAHYGRVYAYTMMSSQFFRDNIDTVKPMTTYLTHRNIMANNCKFWDIYEKIFDVTKDELNSSIERFKMFRRRKLCPLLV